MRLFWLSLFMPALASAAPLPPTIITMTPENRALTVMSSRELSYLSRIHSAREIVMAAADQPRGYLGRVAFSIRATGWDGGALFLNSEEDYRDQRCLSVVIAPPVAREVLALLGGNESAALRRKVILATGLARRVRIEIIDDKQRPTGKYYYQTHMLIESPNQLRIVDLN